MFTLLKRNSFLLLFLFLPSCYFFLPIEPIARIDDEFLAEYGSRVRKAKKIYYKSLSQKKNKEYVDFEKTAYGKIIQAELDFIENNAKNNPFISINTPNDSKVEYLTYNSAQYKVIDDNIFDEIKIPNNDFKYYNLGRKDYQEINNIELQEAYDYIQLINQEIFKQTEIARLKAEAEKKPVSKKSTINPSTIVDKTKENLKVLTDRIKGLVNGN